MSGAYQRLRSVVSRHGMEGITLVLLAVSSGLNVVQASRISIANGVIRQLKGQGRVAVGTTLRPLTAQTLDGRTTQIRFDDVAVPTVLYVFSPSCGWCTKNLDNLHALAGNVGGTPARVIGISMVDKDLEAYIAANRLTFPVYKLPNQASRDEYKLGGTPDTLVISPEGKLLKSWAGAYTGESAKAIARYFRLRLPGLRETVTASQ